jgi:hypothetical protein
MATINWDAERERFTEVAYPFALRSAKRAFKKWPERKRADAEAEFMAKMWDQWKRLLDKGSDPVPLLWPLIHWARQWVRYDRRLAGRAHNIDIQDYRAGMVQHVMDGRGQLKPHDRAARINGFLDWAGEARTDDPSALVAALEQAGLTLDEYLAA